jgi:hypothetical protein
MIMVLEMLRSYKGLYIETQRYKDIYLRLNDEIGVRGVSYDAQPSGTSKLSQTERDAIKLVEAMTDYLDRYNQATARMIEIDKMIQRVSDPRGRYVLHERYIKFRTMDEISGDDMVDRTRRQAYRYHDQAIEELERIYEKK